MPTYKTPGVYIEEISTLPPSVAEVATAIPAFIGYTVKGTAGAVEVAQVNTLLEYELRFGRAGATTFTAADDGTIDALASKLPGYSLWYALNLYFKNGGGRCYVISVDNEATALSTVRRAAGMPSAESETSATSSACGKRWVSPPSGDASGVTS